MFPGGFLQTHIITLDRPRLPTSSLLTVGPSQVPTLFSICLGLKLKPSAPSLPIETPIETKSMSESIVHSLDLGDASGGGKAGPHRPTFLDTLSLARVVWPFSIAQPNADPTRWLQ